jgi:hypothetical protein
LIVNGGRGGREDIDLAMDSFVARIAGANWLDGAAAAQGTIGD